MLSHIVDSRFGQIKHLIRVQCTMSGLTSIIQMYIYSPQR